MTKRRFGAGGPHPAAGTVPSPARRVSPHGWDAGLFFEETDRTLAVMHGSSRRGDGGAALGGLAAVFAELLGPAAS